MPGFDGRWTVEGEEIAAGEGAGLGLEGQGALLEHAFGRGGVRRVGEAVLRPYRRGGWMAKVNGRFYASPARFRQELAIHRALWEAGFPTVEPLGLAWRRAGLAVEGVFLTRFSEARPWPADWSAPVVPELVKAIRALSGWGLWAPDLNATNVLWGDQGLVLLDWDRATWADGDLRPRYLARLGRSLAKLGAPGDLHLALDQGLAGSGSSRS